MKYTFECSEKEFLSVTGVLNTLIKQVAKVTKVKAKNYVNLINTERVVESEVCEDCDDNDLEEEPKPASVHPFRVVKPTEQEVEDSIVSEPEPFPADIIKKQKRLRKGEKALIEFVHEWLKGIDLQTMELIPGVEQPDRDMLLRATANSPAAFSILTYVAECGGLQRAVAKVTNDEDLAVRLCRFIVPPASIAFPDLSDQYEYTNPFQKEDDEDGYA
jgi:hypothetical protein